jgi:hypothetical protein
VRNHRVVGLTLMTVMLLTVPGCAASPARSAGSLQPSPVPASQVAPPATVRVPDVSAAIKQHEFAASYDEDPQAAARELEAFVTDYLDARGLKADVRLQSVAQKDTQVPAAGAVVASGTVVKVRVGFGD